MSKRKKRSALKETSLTHVTSKILTNTISKPFSRRSLPKASTKHINYLKEDCLSLKNVKLRKIVPRDVVPPQSPNSEYEFQDTFKPIPRFPNLNKLEIPYVREKGVKYCINHFGKYFSCVDYTTNYLQFWFLDIITDCVWCLQDEFLLPIHLQKVVLNWFLYFIDLIRNHKLNLSRQNFFNIFKEAIVIAAEILDEGSNMVPSPEEVFQLIDDKDHSDIDPSDLTSSLSSIVINQSDYENPSYLEIDNEDEQRVFELPPESCQCEDFDLSTIYSMTESDSILSEEERSMYIDQEGHIEDDMSFYKPDFNIPSRFLSSFDEDVEDDKIDNKCEEVFSKIEQNSFITENDEHFEIYEVKDKFEIASKSNTPSESTNSNQNLSETLFVKESTKHLTDKKQKNSKIMTDEDILKALTVQKLWEQRLLDMNDPSKGWISYESDMEVHAVEDEKTQKEEESNDEEDYDDEWVDMIVNNKSQKTREFEDNAVLNFGVLWAIIEIVFKYFYESFQFSLVKMAFHATPEMITQKVNRVWHTIKVNKIPVDKPKYEPKPPPPSPPAKKPPEANDKPPLPIQNKVTSEPIKLPEKPKVTADEEKALLAKLEKQRLEELQIEEEMRKMEENKIYLFPLTEGATDDLYRQIFLNWGKEKEKPGKK